MDQPTELALAMQDAWAIRLRQYFSAMGMVLVLYDGLLTITDEVRLVWPGLFNFPKVLYYINRYLTAIAMLYCTYEVASFRPAVSTQFCRAWVLVSGISVAIASTASTALLTLRVTALYRNMRWAVWLLWLAFALFQGLRAVTFTIGAAFTYTKTEYSPISHMCEAGNVANRSAGFLAIVPIVFDILLLVLTTSKVMRSPASLKSNTILFALVRDELLIFFILTSLRVVNALVYFFLPAWSISTVIYAEWGSDSVLTSRFFMNLRSIAYHQRTSKFESHPPFEPSHARLQSVRKQSGRLMTTNFVGLEMHKTIYSSGVSPNEGGIEQADIFHLEVIDSQADQQPLKDQG